MPPNHCTLYIVSMIGGGLKLFSSLRCYILVCFLVVVSIFSLAQAGQNLLQQGMSAYRTKDYQTAWSILYPLARKGQMDAQRLIGVMYRHGLGVNKNDDEAIKWYRKAAQQGHVRAQKLWLRFMTKDFIALKKMRLRQNSGIRERV